jgi:hypothetical protein
MATINGTSGDDGNGPPDDLGFGGTGANECSSRFLAGAWIKVRCARMGEHRWAQHVLHASRE